MKRYLITALLLLGGSSAFSQVNYVLNPDFEEFYFCPPNNEYIHAAKYWTAVDSTPRSACSPDYCHTCVDPMINPVNSIPLSRTYWQHPRSGNGMAQFVTFYDESQPYYAPRNYLLGRLASRLKANKSYCVLFYVNLVEASKYAMKEIGAYLDNGSIIKAGNCIYPLTTCIPQVSNAGGVISDTANWIKIEGSFIANGTERFITIGNFKSTSETTHMALGKNSFNTDVYQSLYLIDDVSVIESDLPAYAGPDTHVGMGDSVYIGRPKEVGLECSWSVLGSTAVIGSGGGIWVKPTATTSYVVTQTLCGSVKRDTVRVEVWGVGLSGVSRHGAQAYSLSPNPTGGLIQLSQTISDGRPVSVRVYNSLGATVYSSSITFENRGFHLEMSGVAPGMYRMFLHDGAGTDYSLTFIKK